MEHSAKVEIIISRKQISDAFIIKNWIERRKKQQRKQIASNISHHGCDFDVTTYEKGNYSQMNKSYIDTVC